jgi:hypothetical protein
MRRGIEIEEVKTMNRVDRKWPVAGIAGKAGKRGNRVP